MTCNGDSDVLSTYQDTKNTMAWSIKMAIRFQVILSHMPESELRGPAVVVQNANIEMSSDPVLIPDGRCIFGCVDFEDGDLL